MAFEYERKQEAADAPPGAQQKRDREREAARLRKWELEQDRMIEEAIAGGALSLLDRVNARLWPDCAVCAGWRGVLIGVLVCVAFGAFFWLFN